MTHAINDRTQLNVPVFMRPFASIVKALIRQMTSFRLNVIPLSYEQAERWSGFIRRWPGIYDGFTFSRQVSVAPGITMNLGIIDVIERNLITRGTWETSVGEVLNRTLKPGDHFLDVGANIGYFSLMASNLVGKDGLVLACEPSVRALSKLVTHIHQNTEKNVVLLSAGAGIESSIETLHLAQDTNIGASTLRKISDHSAGDEKVLVLNLGEMLDGLKFAPDVIKIDVEGYEFSVLKGIRTLLSNTSPVVICELSNAFFADMGHTTGDVINFMASMGYFCYMIENNANLLGRYITSEDQFPDYSLDVVFCKARLACLPTG